MEAWRKVWRDGLVPILPTKGLEALLEALRTDDKTLLQLVTTQPPSLECVRDWPCEGGCALAYVGWKAEGLKTVRDVESAFIAYCYECDQRLGKPAESRWFLEFVDETPRDEMRKELIPEVELELERRKTP